MFRDIIGYEGMYEISDEGEVKSLGSGRGGLGKERIMMPLRVNQIYSRIGLSKDRKVRSYKVHRLVAIMFIDNPENKPCVCHIDETLDENGLLYNGVDNLFWGTQKDNSQDRNRKGRGNYKSGSEHHNSKSIDQYSQDGEFIKRWGATRDVERALGINHASISYCCLGKLKTAGKFIWKHAV